jgi:phosphatidate phosphatase APP1
LSKQVDHLYIQSYSGYAFADGLRVTGRVLNQKPKISKSDVTPSAWRTSLNNFNTYEIKNVQVTLWYNEKRVACCVTNSEGYYFFEVHVPCETIDETQTKWLPYKVQCNYQEFAQEKKSWALRPNALFDYGIISDLDDTLIHTGVNSFLKWELIKNSIFTLAEERVPIDYASQFYQALQNQSKGVDRPFFYLSNSPFNLYSYLQVFLRIHNFPRGVLLLRDFPNLWRQMFNREKPHKQKEILQILNIFSDKSFVLIGDSGEHDPSIYTEIAQMHPSRIKAIFLRRVKSKSKMQLANRVVSEFKATPVVFFSNGKEAIIAAKKMGLIQ